MWHPPPHGHVLNVSPGTIGSTPKSRAVTREIIIVIPFQISVTHTLDPHQARYHQPASLAPAMRRPLKLSSARKACVLLMLMLTAPFGET